MHLTYFIPKIYINSLPQFVEKGLEEYICCETIENEKPNPFAVHEGFVDVYHINVGFLRTVVPIFAWQTCMD